MKKFRLIAALVLVLSLVLCLPFSIQAQEPQFHEVYLDAGYKISDTQIVLEFSEPIKVNVKNPWYDIRMTNREGTIQARYDAAGNQIGWYMWNVTLEYFNSDHDKLLVTLKDSLCDCDTISELVNAQGSFSEDVKEKINNGTYRFIVNVEELYFGNPNDYINDGNLQNLVSEANPEAYVWPNKLGNGEAVIWWLDELLPKPANMVVDASKFEALTGGGQDWESSILSAGEIEDTETEEAEPDVVTMVKYDPLRIAAILGAGVLAAVVLVLVFILASKKRKAV